MEQAIAAARAIDRIDRRVCRETFERRFTARVMAQQYLELYRSLAESPSTVAA
jgi:hypothetical protein